MGRRCDDGKCDATGPIFRDYCYCVRYRGPVNGFYWTHHLQRVIWLSWSGLILQGNVYRLAFLISPGARVYRLWWLRDWQGAGHTRRWYE